MGAALGCGSATHDASTHHDAGTSATDSGAADHASQHDAVAMTKDGGREDAGADAGMDAGPPPTPEGTTLQTGAHMVIQGVTDDGYIVYTSATSVNAVAETGGTPVVIAELGDAGPGTGYAMVVHDVVFVWTNLGSSSSGPLTVWSHGLGIPQPVSTASLAGVASASQDSSTVVYTSDVTVSGATASLVGATMATLSAPATLAASIDAATQVCAPNVSFSGATAPVYAVAELCPVSDAGTAGPSTVYSYLTPTWSAKTLATAATAYSVDATGTNAAITLGSGQLEIAPLSGAAVIPIDGAATLFSTSTVYLSQTDAFVLYDTSAGALKASTVTASSPQTLVASNVNAIDGVASSEKWALVNHGTDMTTMLPSDLSLASTTTPGTPTLLTTGTTVAGVLGDAFTADPASSYAIFMTGISLDANYNAVGALKAVATATPGTILSLATAAVNSTSFSPSDLALTGTKISFTDNFNPNRGATGSVDLHVVDLATSTPSTLVMKGADPLYAVTFDKSYLVYTIAFGGSTDGLYAVAVP